MLLLGMLLPTSKPISGKFCSARLRHPHTVRVRMHSMPTPACTQSLNFMIYSGTAMHS